MGTNFYFFSKEKEPCETWFGNTYELSDEQDFGYEVHLAKTSGGWLPLFQAHERCRSVLEMKAIYDTGLFQIKDEYGQLYSWKEFDERVLQFNGGVVGAIPTKPYKQDTSSPFYDKDMPDHTPVSHFEYGHGKYADQYFRDAQGYEFDTRWFL